MAGAFGGNLLAGGSGDGTIASSGGGAQSDPARWHTDAEVEPTIPGRLARRVFLAAGLLDACSNDPLRRDDAELLRLVARAIAAGLPESAVVRCLRVFGASLRRMVETMLDISRADMEGRLLATGLPYGEMRHQSLALRNEIYALSCRAVSLLQRRLLEEAIRTDAAARVPTAPAGTKLGGRARSAIAFVDLSGFTRLTEEVGDDAAAERATRLEELAQEVGGTSGGELVKSVGDGVMLAFTDPAAAVGCGVGLIAGARHNGLPPARVGVACGPVTRRNGDLFGRTVNLAARLADYARPRELLATPEVVAALDDDTAAEFRPIGPVLLRGLVEPVALYGAQTADP